MKINYEDLIRHANERIGQLQAFDAMLQAAPEHAAALLAATQYFVDLGTALKALDYESQAMLDEGVRGRVKAIAETVERSYPLLTGLSKLSGSDAASLTGFIALLESIK